MTLVLDEKTREAARQLATRFECSTSEAVRRAVVSHRNFIFGVSPETRERRLGILHQLFDLFEGHDAEEEIRRLKLEDEGS